MKHGKGSPSCFCDYTDGDKSFECECCHAGIDIPCDPGPSQAVVSPTKREISDEDYFRNRFWEALRIVQVCTAHIPCCWGKGLKTPYKQCKSAKDFKPMSCVCHEGRP